MSLYRSYDGVAPFRQKPYPKRRPSRSSESRLALLDSLEAAATDQNISYQEFINGDFHVAPVQLTA